MRLTKINMPWGKGLGCLGFKFGDEWYFDFYLSGRQLNFWPYWYVKVPIMYIGWKKSWGKFKPRWLCKSCSPKERWWWCMRDGYCNAPRTYINLFTFKVNHS